MSINAVKHIIATVFSAQNALRELAPEFKWAGMGNLLGDYGEYVCIETTTLQRHQQVQMVLMQLQKMEELYK